MKSVKYVLQQLPVHSILFVYLLWNSIHQVITERELEVNVKVEGSDPVTMKFMNTDTVKKIAERLQEMNLVENNHPRIFVSSWLDINVSYTAFLD